MLMRLGRGAAMRSAIVALGAIQIPSARLPAIAYENEGSFAATCAGFGCNDYRGQSFDGMPATGDHVQLMPYTNQEIGPASVNTMPYPDFLDAVKEKRVLAVDLMAPNGDEAYALVADEGKGKACAAYDQSAPVVDGVCRLRMGAGWPVEVSNSWSSPAWVVRILKNENIPYQFVVDLKTKRRTY
uniref:Uncharacterized protein n=1 Tax=Coccolithus braarudii TaxID=221442 RepID=A0A7S0KYC6_9EUKA